MELPPPSDSPSTKCEFCGRLNLAWRNWDTGDLHGADLKFSENPDRDHWAQLLGYAEGPEHFICYAVQERRGRFVIPDVQAAWEAVAALRSVGFFS